MLWSIQLSMALLIGLACPSVSMADENAVTGSLKAFLSHVVLKNGETVELMRIEHMPDMEKEQPVHWSLPTMQGYPERISLIAEQRTETGLRRWYVPVKLRWWGEGVTLRHPIMRGQVIQSPHLEKKRVNLTGHHGTWLPKRDQVIGLRATRSLSAGEPIFAHMLKRPPIIQRGDIVTLLFRAGRIMVKAKAKALRSAAFGDALLVRPINGVAAVQGIAVGPHLVRVSYGG